MQEWTWRQCAASVFQWHNESVNIWRALHAAASKGASPRPARLPPPRRLTARRRPARSHLLGCAYFAHRARQLACGGRGSEFAGSLLADRSPSPAPTAPRWPLYVFLAGACTCLLISAVCHTLCCVSRRVNAKIWRVDYSGICLLIAGSFYPPVSYSFTCHPRWRVFYLGLISAAACATLTMCLADRFAGPSWRAARALTFSALGGFGIVPILHQSFFLWSPAPMPRRLGQAVLWELLMGVLYLSGAYLYARRIPERFRPGAFDYFFHSHSALRHGGVAARRRPGGSCVYDVSSPLSLCFFLGQISSIFLWWPPRQCTCTRA